MHELNSPCPPPPAAPSLSVRIRRDKTLKEVGFLQSLDHPNVIRYMDSFITDNDLVIVFEWAGEFLERVWVGVCTCI